MRHVPQIDTVNGCLVAVRGCMCGWKPSAAAENTDTHFAVHVALEILHGPGLGDGPPTLDRRVDKFTAWATDRLIRAAEYFDQYGAASYAASGRETETETILVALHILAGRAQDLVPLPISDDELTHLRQLAEATTWDSEMIDRIGELLPKLLAKIDAKETL